MVACCGTACGTCVPYTAVRRSGSTVRFGCRGVGWTCIVAACSLCCSRERHIRHLRFCEIFSGDGSEGGGRDIPSDPSSPRVLSWPENESSNPQIPIVLPL
jgi:hypothetical protein